MESGEMVKQFDISIHALLAESDNSGRPHAGGVFPFLSTLSLRRATQYNISARCKVWISIHALLAESDLMFHDNLY